MRYCIYCNTPIETENVKFPIFCKGCQKEVWFIETKKSKEPAKMVFVPANSIGEKNMEKKICPTCGQEIKAQSKKELRIKALKELGIDLSSCFSLSFNDGETINQSDFSDSVSSIVANGYIDNSKLFRRWIMAQTFRLLGENNDWTYRFNRTYNYMYQFKMLLEETKVLAKLEKTKDEMFLERSSIFTSEIIACIVQDYINELNKLVQSKKVHKCKGCPYIKLGRNIFCDELVKKVFDPFDKIEESIRHAESYSQINNALKDLMKSPYFVRIEANISWEFTDAFKKAGCFYTLQNLFRFHNCVIKGYNTEQSIQYIQDMLGDCYGYEFLGLLKDVIAYNNFSFKDRMKEIYSK